MVEAIILAGGLGTRLRTAVPGLPKCMAPINGDPFLKFVIETLQAQGVDRFIFSLGYMHEAIVYYLNHSFPKLSYAISIEDEPLGTGGAIKLALQQANGNTVIATNGDTLFRVDIRALLNKHNLNKSDCTLSLKPMIDFERYGVVELDINDRIKSFREKQYYREGLINGGVYAIDRSHFLSESLPQKFSFEKDYLEGLYMSRKMFGLVQEGYFIDIGIPEDYERAQAELKV